MRQEDLQYWKVVEGKKPHWIFKQGSRYYLMTEKDEGLRGNFSIVDQLEVDRVRKEFAKNSVPKVFHLDDIYASIRGVSGGERLKRENTSGFITRLRDIGYVLVAEGLLGIQKEGHRHFFVKRAGL